MVTCYGNTSKFIIVRLQNEQNNFKLIIIECTVSSYIGNLNLFIIMCV